MSDLTPEQITRVHLRELTLSAPRIKITYPSISGNVIDIAVPVMERLLLQEWPAIRELLLERLKDE